MKLINEQFLNNVNLLFQILLLLGFKTLLNILGHQRRFRRRA